MHVGYKYYFSPHPEPLSSKERGARIIFTPSPFRRGRRRVRYLVLLGIISHQNNIIK